MIIEECGRAGMIGRAVRRRDVARITWHHDVMSPGLPLIATLINVHTGKTMADIYVAGLLVYDDRGFCRGRARDWHDAVKMALGPHPTGYGWYQVKGQERRYVPTGAQ